jgi:hypothetical protein
VNITPGTLRSMNIMWSEPPEYGVTRQFIRDRLPRGVRTSIRSTISAMFRTTSFTAEGSDAGVRVSTRLECRISRCSPTMSRFMLASIRPPSAGPATSGCASIHAIVPFHSGTQTNRSVRRGRGRRPESISSRRVRAMSSRAPEPDALSLADSLG